MQSCATSFRCRAHTWSAQTGHSLPPPPAPPHIHTHTHTHTCMSTVAGTKPSHSKAPLPGTPVTHRGEQTNPNHPPPSSRTSGVLICTLNPYIPPHTPPQDNQCPHLQAVYVKGLHCPPPPKTPPPPTRPPTRPLTTDAVTCRLNLNPLTLTPPPNFATKPTHLTSPAGCECQNTPLQPCRCC
jgi:hypothetical protein